jgi:hypothetical protein
LFLAPHFGADEVLGYFRDRHALRQPQDFWIEIQVAAPAGNYYSGPSATRPSECMLRALMAIGIAAEFGKYCWCDRMGILQSAFVHRNSAVPEV